MESPCRDKAGVADVPTGNVGKVMVWQVEIGEHDLKDLARVCAAYRLGQLRKARYLPIGVINRNWHVDTATGGPRTGPRSPPQSPVTTIASLDRCRVCWLAGRHD